MMVMVLCMSLLWFWCCLLGWIFSPLRLLPNILTAFILVFVSARSKCLYNFVACWVESSTVYSPESEHTAKSQNIRFTTAWNKMSLKPSLLSLPSSEAFGSIQLTSEADIHWWAVLEPKRRGQQVNTAASFSGLSENLYSLPPQMPSGVTC